MAVEEASSDRSGPHGEEEGFVEDWLAPPPGAVPPDGPKHSHYAVAKRLGGGAFGEVLQVRCLLPVAFRGRRAVVFSPLG